MLSVSRPLRAIRIGILYFVLGLVFPSPESFASIGESCKELANKIIETTAAYALHRSPHLQVDLSSSSVENFLLPFIGPKVIRTYPDGKSLISFSFFLPPEFGDQVEILSFKKNIFLQRKWEALTKKNDVWSILIDQVPADSPYLFRYKTPQGKWQEAVDPNAYSFTKNMYDFHKKNSNASFFEDVAGQESSLVIRSSNPKKKIFNARISIGIYENNKLVPPESIAEVEISQFEFNSKAPLFVNLPYAENQGYFSREFAHIPFGAPYIIRYRLKKSNRWKFIVDTKSQAYVNRPEEWPSDIPKVVSRMPNFNELPKKLYLFDSIPKTPSVPYRFKNEGKRPNQPFTILEASLPALLKYFDQGKLYPQSPAELVDQSIVQRLLKTNVLTKIKEAGYNTVMAPIQLSVASMTYYDPRFCYLVSHAGAIDPELGSWLEFKKLIDRWRGKGVEFVPDLIFVHKVQKASEISEEHIVSATNKKLFIDDNPRKHREFNTLMYDFSKPEVRAMLINQVLRFVEELNLRLIRFDYVDGALIQYEREGTENFGAIFIKELTEALNLKAPHLIVAAEAFERANHPVVAKFSNLDYKPWAGSNIVDFMFAPKENKLATFYNLINSIKSANAEGSRPGIEYAFTHDSGMIDPTYYHPEKNGAHIGQLLFDYAGREGLPMSSRLDYMGKRNLLLEAITAMSTGVSFMSTNSMMRLGHWNDPNGWPVVFKGQVHPDIAALAEKTLTKESVVENKINYYANLLTDLRVLFTNLTRIKQTNRKINAEVLIEIGHMNSDKFLFTLNRIDKNHPENTMLVVINLGESALKNYECPTPIDHQKTSAEYKRAWSSEAQVDSSILTNSIWSEIGNAGSVLKVDIPPMSMQVFKYEP